MVALWRIAVGGVAVLLGLAWILAPVRMSRVQSKVLYLGRGKEVEGTDRDVLVGRISGVVLGLLGLALALGVEI